MEELTQAESMFNVECSMWNARDIEHWTLNIDSVSSNGPASEPRLSLVRRA
jgi:hypothetical protein